ncbi:MAG: hypothetical protein DMG12_26645, partial [Acidobacteria bacterium]
MIISSTFVAAGRYTPQGPGGRQQTGPMLPDHCRVIAIAAPSSDSHIVQTGIVLQVGSSPVVNVNLEVGQVTEAIEVQADAALV